MTESTRSVGASIVSRESPKSQRNILENRKRMSINENQ